nr:MAG TPA: Protein of unknown function (DUF613) [Caudoviricetes sp.]
MPPFFILYGSIPVEISQSKNILKFEYFVLDIILILEYNVSTSNETKPGGK